MSSLIIENIINNNNKNLKFDFSKSITENNFSHQVDYDNNLPIDVNNSENSWNYENNDMGQKIKKCYYFKSHKHMLYFLNEYMEKFHKISKSPDIIIKDNSVTVSLFTEEIMQVTEVDLNLSKYLDDVYDDISYIQGL